MCGESLAIENASMAKKRKSRANSSRRLELLEVRQVMSADPLDDLWGQLLTQHGTADSLPEVWQPGGPDDVAVLTQHGAMSPPLLPPDLTNHEWREADFWIDRDLEA